ncbi:RagB/SusD family nutrient uptake outer membrane protein [Pedobacter hiemivivus]|uniref:RagB/SusD family nutrient uptake outer membrane protein n=1 Tax=Pedobacter hiemivivus TaxID=2530454 RepID=A0A4U1GBW2_9SPHI|nr:RagB/SusD family nutrient uptake outer membrane protein [Pedobacter hiemivivus]TKC61465.1 RagB/SusD family nutrient uptake outer membrane protein [Pedobacter hiemivivus]
MKRNLSILLLLSGFFLVSSCKKFLEEQSQTDIIPRSASALNELLLGAAYISSGGPGYDRSLRLLDDDVVQGAFYKYGNNMYFAYTWQPEGVGKDGLTGGSDSWTVLYPRILTCNMVLDYAPKVTGTTAEIENVVGQACLLRAFYYFKLVNLYAKPYSDKLSDPSKDPGVPLMLSSGLSFEGKSRNTVAEVYKQIVEDLDKGIELLERSGKNNNVYRINHIAGYLLSSRVQLQLGNWQKVIDATTNVLNRKSDLMDLTTWGPANQNGKPIIGPVNQENLWVHSNPDEVIFDGITQEGYSYILSDDLISKFETGDLRSSIYLKNKRSIKRPTLGYVAKVGQAFRVSEALLNRAEAYAQLNKLGQTGNGQLALDDLNTLRKKRFTSATYHDLVSSGADDLLQKCYDEKRREFFDEENHRWFDLRRHDMPSFTHSYYESDVQVLKYVLLDHDPGYVLQIPKIALDKNVKLTRNPDPARRIGH